MSQAAAIAGDTLLSQGAAPGTAPDLKALQPLRVVMLATKFYATSDMGGGLERSARRLFEPLIRAGYAITVLTRNYDRLPAQDTVDDVAVQRIALWGQARVLVSLSYLAGSLWWLITRRARYDLIHCHQSYAPAVIGALAKRLTGRPVIVKISTADEFSERRELERLPGFGIRRWLLRRVDRFVAVNASAREEFAGLGVAPERIVHIPNGVPVPPRAAFDPGVREAARQRVHAPGGRIVLFTGRLSAEKNLHVLLEAWPAVLRACPDAHLLLVGDGGTFRNVEPALRRQAAVLGIEACVHFVGRVADVQPYLLASDLFVLPSQTEGMSNALLEAMAAGLPVVATRIPGNAAVVEHGVTGLLVERGEAPALAQAIVALLRDADTSERLGRSARRAAAAQFSAERVAAAYGRLYASLVHPAPAATGRRFARRAGLVGLGLALSLGACELITRIIPLSVDSFPPIYQAHPVRQFDLRPLAAGRSFRGIAYRVNADGLRDRHYPFDKGPMRRILVAGDSVTMGYGLPADATYPKRLEQLLNASQDRRRTDVLNFGINGYNTFQEASLLAEKGPAYQPDLIVIGLLSNDFAEGPTPFRVEGGELLDPDSAGVPLAMKRWLRRSSLYWLIGQLRTQGWRPWQRGPQAAGRIDADRAVFERSWVVYRGTLVSLTDTASRANAALLFCYLPSRIEVLSGRPSQPYHSAVAAYAETTGAAFVDMTAMFVASWRSAAELFLPADPVHLSRAGHQMVAERLREYLHAHPL